MDNCISDPEVVFRQLSARMVESAAYSAECGAAALYLCGDDGSASVAASFGNAFAPIAPVVFASLMEAMDGLEPGAGIFFGGAPDALTYGLCADAGAAPRFVAAVRITDSERRTLGVLAIADALPRRELSAAKAYVLMTQALQIADAICLKQARQRPAAQPRQSERLRLLESVVVNAKDSILITEAEPTALPGPRIVYCNAAFSATTGYAEAEVLGKTPRILQGPGTDPVARAKIREALRAWKPIEIELLNYKKTGEEFWVELSIVPVAD
jgi:PAS domain S-box-containing protein